MNLFKSKTLFITTICLLFFSLNTFAQNPKQVEKTKHCFQRINNNFNEKIIMGTITSIDENSKFIVITDADGKNKKVHINPLTHICLINREKKFHKNNNEKNFNTEKKHFTNLTFNDLKIGNWIIVKKFNTDTETLEALSIKAFF